MDYFLEILRITEEDFNEIAIKHAVHPYHHDFEKTERGEILWDMEQWDRSAPLEKGEAIKQIDKFNHNGVKE